ncbi:MAG: hypothetical protein QGG42_11290 [Phycisphaerae bacterium]|jgi:hypothetical protein|nr:hypothetical protein [Phycisphaerae bacterium]
MSSGDPGYSGIGGDETELVPAVFARDAEEAQRYCELLADHGIVGIIAADGVDAGDAEISGDVGEGTGMTSGVAVLVEDALLDEAGLVIADREDLAEFQFGEDDEVEDEDDELDFAQGIDSDFEDDSGPVDLGLISSGRDDVSGALGDEEEDDDLGLDVEFDDEFGDETDVD